MNRNSILFKYAELKLDTFQKCLKIDVFKCFLYKYDTFCIDWVDFRYLWNVLKQNSILFKYFGSKLGTFRMFWIQDILFSTFLCTNTKFFEVFVYKVTKLFKYDVQRLNSFECFETKEDIFQIFGVEFPYISNYFGTKSDAFTLFGYTNQILFECSSQKQIFPNVLLKTECFGVRIKYFSNVLNRICILFQCFGQNSILFKCFIANSDYFQLFWKEN